VEADSATPELRSSIDQPFSLTSNNSLESLSYTGAGSATGSLHWSLQAAGHWSLSSNNTTESLREFLFCRRVLRIDCMNVNQKFSLLFVLT